MTDDDCDDWEPSSSWLKREPALRFTPELRRASRVAGSGHSLRPWADVEADAASDAAAIEAAAKEAAAKEAAADAYLAAMRALKR